MQIRDPRLHATERFQVTVGSLLLSVDYKAKRRVPRGWVWGFWSLGDFWGLRFRV